jgi:hypothetical protein
VALAEALGDLNGGASVYERGSEVMGAQMGTDIAPVTTEGLWRRRVAGSSNGSGCAVVAAVRSVVQWHAILTVVLLWCGGRRRCHWVVVVCPGSLHVEQASNLSVRVRGVLRWKPATWSSPSPTLLATIALASAILSRRAAFESEG